MIYITGDKHADFRDVFGFCKNNKTHSDDILIILGDSGINYFNNEQDYILKANLSKYPITLFYIHGNHEERPEKIGTYQLKEFYGGKVYYEGEYPNILFARDGEIYNFNDNKVLVIGGAYSVDKFYRLRMGYKWYASEQPDEATKENILKVLSKLNNQVDIILSHTCPYKYLPREMFLSGIDESTVDYTTEYFLDKIEDTTKYNKWYCGHYHTDKRIDKMVFMYHGIEEFDSN